METNEIIKAIKISAFDAIVKAFRAKDSYFKRTDAILEIVTEAQRLIGEAKRHGGA